MIFIIVGPSGAGKTTFMELALRYTHELKIIDIDVLSLAGRDYDKTLGRKEIDLSTYEKRISEKYYDHIYEYGGSKYGLRIRDIDADIDYLLDYPGEYPECLEFSSYKWKGILILPPTQEELVNRLKNCHREYRIKSSIAEYVECLDDIKKHKFNNWHIIINTTTKVFEKCIIEDQIFTTHSE